jgi:hypothetical protein
VGFGNSVPKKAKVDFGVLKPRWASVPKAEVGFVVALR